MNSDVAYSARRIHEVADLITYAESKNLGPTLSIDELEAELLASLDNLRKHYDVGEPTEDVDDEYVEPIDDEYVFEDDGA